jgi:hypothetical protein
VYGPPLPEERVVVFEFGTSDSSNMKSAPISREMVKMRIAILTNIVNIIYSTKIPYVFSHVKQFRYSLS